MARPKGWRKEPARHALAARGVKTATPKVTGASSRYVPANAKHHHALANFPTKDEKTMDALFDAMSNLRAAGVDFDSGSDLKSLDWELDFSLQGAWVDSSGNLHIPISDQDYAYDSVLTAEDQLIGAGILRSEDVSVVSHNEKKDGQTVPVITQEVWNLKRYIQWRDGEGRILREHEGITQEDVVYKENLI